MNLEGNLYMEGNDLVICIDGRIWKRKQIRRGIRDNAGYEEYNDAVYRFLQDHGIMEYPRYHQKVWMAFTQHYVERKRMLDVDNMETKPFIDAISMYLMEDDSPEQCAIILDGKLDDREYLEIRISSYV